MRLGAPELLIILAVVLILFGGQRVPQLGAALGQAIRNFKRGFSGDDATVNAQETHVVPPASSTIRKDV